MSIAGVWLLCAAAVAAARRRRRAPLGPCETLVERTVAIVGGAVITASDVRSALALGLVEAGGPDAERDATARLIDRRLMLLEVARFAPTEPAAALIDGRVATITARAGAPDALAATLARGGYGQAGWPRGCATICGSPPTSTSGSRRRDDWRGRGGRLSRASTPTTSPRPA